VPSGDHTNHAPPANRRNGMASVTRSPGVRPCP
jgi:hypothetical protein